MKRHYENPKPTPPAPNITNVKNCSKCKYLRAINEGKVYALCVAKAKVFELFEEDTRTSLCNFYEDKL